MLLPARGSLLLAELYQRFLSAVIKAASLPQADEFYACSAPMLGMQLPGLSLKDKLLF